MNDVEQYPKDFQEFLVQFKSDDDCWNYLFDMRWPNGYSCPKCQQEKYWITDKKLIHCVLHLSYQKKATQKSISA
jgi:hypothetical protein